MLKKLIFQLFDSQYKNVTSEQYVELINLKHTAFKCLSMYEQFKLCNNFFLIKKSI